MASHTKKSAENSKNQPKRLSQSWLGLERPFFKLGKAEITAKKAILLSLREAYLFLRNLLGLTFHPYKTMRAIRRQQDYSQVVLLSSWPVVIWLALVTLLIAIKLFFQPLGRLALVLKALFALYSFFVLFYTLYLVYWFIFYYRVSRRIKSQNESD